jgi:hypothetical protein
MAWIMPDYVYTDTPVIETSRIEIRKPVVVGSLLTGNVTEHATRKFSTHLGIIPVALCCLRENHRIRTTGLPEIQWNGESRNGVLHPSVNIPEEISVVGDPNGNTHRIVKWSLVGVITRERLNIDGVAYAQIAWILGTLRPALTAEKQNRYNHHSEK